MSAPAEVQEEWARRVVAEYRSAAFSQELALWLLQVGDSVDLVREAQRIAGEELDHAERSMDVLAATGGAVGPIDRASLSLGRTAAPLEHDLLRVGVELFCVGETVAVPLFRRMLDGATVPLVRRTLTRILADEARHRRFGWTLLEAALERPDGPELRDMLAGALPGMRRRVEAAYGDGVGDTIVAEARAWGLLPPGAYDEALRTTTHRWYRPRFAAVGLAW
ncbi:MAG: ferritin-like domain-containing protein [Pseudomonadota bacterium]|nr:ferritin-like domain-containing protein [Pseudomonadota bacterium]